MSLREFMANRRAKGFKSFHMPGHKGNMRSILGETYALDITEVEGADNLHNPTGIIKYVESLAQELYGGNCYLAINGTTAAIYAMVSANLKRGDSILIERNAHRSVHNIAMLLGLKVDYIYPMLSEDLGLPLGVGVDEVKAKLRGHKAIVLTYPNYYGITIDLEGIAKLCKEQGVVLLVDGAHSSHFRFDDAFPSCPLELGADLVAFSTHKTLLSLTQSSILVDNIATKNIRKHMSLFQSTSPSYILMASLEESFARIKGEKGLFDEQLKGLSMLYERSESFKNIRLLKGSMLKKGFGHDISRVVVNISKVDISAKEASDILRDKFGIEIEFYDSNNLILITTLNNRIEDFGMLIKALECIDGYGSAQGEGIYLQYIMPRRGASLEEAFYGDEERVRLEDSIFRISSSFVIPYPPGIPLLCPGEIIDGNVLDRIDTLKSKGIEIIGVDEYISVLRR